MISISDKDNTLTVVNIFFVNQEQQEGLINFLKENQDIPIKQPGFISASVHKSLDGKRLINYIQWENQEALELASKDPEFTNMTKEAAKIAELDFNTYEVVFTKQSFD